MLATPMITLRRASRSPRAVEIARKLGVSPSRVSGVETGRVEASDEFLREYAKLVGFSLLQVKRMYLESRRAFFRRAERQVVEALRQIEAQERQKSA